jgi:hypothetical protein
MANGQLPNGQKANALPAWLVQPAIAEEQPQFCGGAGAAPEKK